MIRIEKQMHGVPMIITWYEDAAISDNGIINYREAKTPIGESEEFITLLSDLTKEPDAIKADFSKNCRYEVNRADREDVCYEITDGKEISDALINEFITFFEDFWKSKDSSLDNPESLREELLAYRDGGYLTIGCAVVSGQKAVYHTYLHDEIITRLMHSASLFRVQENEEKNNKAVLGIANRALHFEEMKYFKSKGIETYDWGGAGETEEVASITKFKKSFGGTPAVFYDCHQLNGSKAKLISTMADIKNHLKK